MTSADLVIADLAALLEQRECELVLYREMVQVSLEQLADAEAQHAGTLAQCAHLRAEIRRYTAARVQP